MTVLDAAYWVACVVLVVSGASKLVDPVATQSTLRGLDLPAPRFAGRALGVAEVFVGAAGLLAAPGAVAQAIAVFVALLYGCFALIVAAAYRRDLDDCGCLGVRSRRPSRGHVVMNACIGVLAAAAAAVGPIDLWGGLSSLSGALAVAVALSVAVVAGVVVATA